MSNKPIAILGNTHSRTERWVFTEYLKDKIKEFNIPKTKIIDNNDQIYLIVYNPNHLMGLEISDYILVPDDFWNHMDANYFVALAKTRIRK